MGRGKRSAGHATAQPRDFAAESGGHWPLGDGRGVDADPRAYVEHAHALFSRYRNGAAGVLLSLEGEWKDGGETQQRAANGARRLRELTGISDNGDFDHSDEQLKRRRGEMELLYPDQLAVMVFVLGDADESEVNLAFGEGIRRARAELAQRMMADAISPIPVEERYKPGTPLQFGRD